MMKNNVDGYKCFNKNLICNQESFKMEEKKLYKIDEDIKFRHKGFHFCVRLEDTLRFFGGIDDEKEICKIKAVGDIFWESDEYNGYYDMGVTNAIYIDHILSRDEIMEYVDGLTDHRFIRFIMGYKLTKEELEYFKNKYINNFRVSNYLSYYQEKELDIFYKKRKLIK